ncbi:MAG: PAS domain-containing protein, partial [Candidatus Krumholzibacteria bacterium]|nr:PAS domain-containing protein [Candidatus Krumholzibacteria bacterium]
MATDSKKTKAELVADLAELRARMAETEDRGVGPRLFRDLMDQSGDILAVIEPGSGLLLDTNERMSELLGYNRAELLTMKVMDFDTMVSDQGTWDTFVEELRPQGSVALESVLKRKDGHEFPVEITARITADRQREFMVIVSRDITERKRAEGELRKSREMAHSLLNATRDLVFLIDPDGCVRDLNEAAAQSIGRSQDQLIGTNIFSYFPPETAQFRKTKFAESLATGKAAHVHDKRDGKAFDTYVYPILDDEGSAEFLAVYASDVTAHKNAQEELRAERVFIEAALDASSDTFLVFDTTNGKPVRWNRVFREVSGYSDDEIAGMKAPDDFYEERDLEIAASALGMLSNTTCVRIDLPLLNKKGMKIPYEYALTIIDSGDGEASLACSVGRDVTEQRLAEEALRHSEETYRGFLDSLNAGVVAHAPDSTTLYWNRMSLQILGLTEDQMLGKTAYNPQWHFLNEDGSVMAVDDYPVNLTLRTHSDLYGYVAGIVRPGINDVLWVICNSHRILADNGELEHV